MAQINNKEFDKICNKAFSLDQLKNFILDHDKSDDYNIVSNKIIACVFCMMANIMAEFDKIYKIVLELEKSIGINFDLTKDIKQIIKDMIPK